MPNSARVGRSALLALAALLSITPTGSDGAGLSTQTVRELAPAFPARVVRVLDGDTVEVKRTLEQRVRPIRIRVEGIDAPERGKAFSTAARNFTRQLVFDRDVMVQPRDVDRYGRLVARIVVDGKDLSRELAAAGLAWHYTVFSFDTVLGEAERRARAERKGMWAAGDAKPPWRRPR